MFRIFTITLLVFLVLFLPATAQQHTSAEELLTCAQANWNSATFVGVMTIKAFRPDFSSEFKLQVWSTENNDKAMIRVLEPEDEAGSGYLQEGDELWFYTAAAGQVIPLPSSSLGEAFFGSDVAVEDLYRGTLNDRYTAELLGTRNDNDTQRLVHRLRLVPKPDADVVYGKLELDLFDSDCAVFRIDFFDQRDTLIREGVFSEFVEENGLVFATHSVVNDLLREGSYTEQIIESFEIGVEIPEARFTLECLEDDEQCG